MALSFKYQLVDGDGNVLFQKNERYPIVTEAIKREKAGESYQILMRDQNGDYVRDENGHDQVVSRPQIIAARQGKTVSNSTVNKEFLNALTRLADASKALAGMERKGEANEEAIMEWLNECFTVMTHTGVDRRVITQYVNEAFPRQHETASA